MDGNEFAPPVRRGADGRFAPGHGGRPFGSRNRASKRVARLGEEARAGDRHN